MGVTFKIANVIILLGKNNFHYAKLKVISLINFWGVHSKTSGRWGHRPRQSGTWVTKRKSYFVRVENDSKELASFKTIRNPNSNLAKIKFHQNQKLSKLLFSQP